MEFQAASIQRFRRRKKSRCCAVIRCSKRSTRNLRAARRERQDPRRCPRGTTLFTKGDAGTCLFAVYNGVGADDRRVERKARAPCSIRSAPARFFGEIALLDGQPRTADAMAVHRLPVDDHRAGADFLPLLA